MAKTIGRHITNTAALVQLLEGYRDATPQTQNLIDLSAWDSDPEAIEVAFDIRSAIVKSGCRITWREPGTFPYVRNGIVVQHNEDDPQWRNIALGVVSALQHGGLSAVAEPIQSPGALDSPIRIIVGKH
jgi:hypothetical protein